MKKTFYISLLFFVAQIGLLQAQQTRFKIEIPDSDSNLYYANGVVEYQPKKFLATISDFFWSPSDTQIHVFQLMTFNEFGQVQSRAPYRQIADTVLRIVNSIKIGDEIVLMGGAIVDTGISKRNFGFLAFLDAQTLTLKKELFFNTNNIFPEKSVFKKFRDSSYVFMARDFNGGSHFVIRFSRTLEYRDLKFVTNVRQTTHAMGDINDIDESDNPGEYIMFADFGLIAIDTGLTRVREFNRVTLDHFARINSGSFIRRGSNEYVYPSTGFVDTGLIQNLLFVHEKEGFTSVTDIGLPCFSVPWHKSVDTTSDGSVYFAGEIERRSKIYIQKLNRNLVKIWAKTYDYGGSFDIMHFSATSDNGAIICGGRFDWALGIYNIFILKIDGNGSTVSETSIPLAVPKLKVFPNPARDFLQVELPKDIEQATIRVYDLSGKLVLEQPSISSEQALDIQALTAGTYVLQAWGKSQILGTAKWVKVE
jgi:hypothetical protein